jgi:PAS domain S-box-containing protein
LGLLLENSRLNQNLRTNTEEMALVDEIARIVTSTLEIDQVYEKFGAELKKLVDFQRMAISLIHHEAGTYTVKYVVGQDIPGHNIGQVRALTSSSMQEVVVSGQTSIREEIADGPMFPGDQAILSAGLHSNVRVPLIYKGRLVGTLSLRNHRPGTYGVREQTILERLASQIAPGIENAQLYEKTREDEEQLRKLSQAVEQNPSAVMITDAQGNIQYVNLKFTHITGYVPDEVIGKTPRILKSDQTSVEEHQELWRAITAGGEWHGERLNRKKNGELYWSSQSISPIRNGQGEITHFVAVIEDITQRKELEAAERLRTQELEALVNIADILVRPESFEERCGAIMEELVRIGEASGRPSAFPAKTASVSSV